MRMSFGGFLVAAMCLGQLAQAQITPEVLMFRHYAHQARDLRGLAEGEDTSSTIRVKQAEFRYQMAQTLFMKKATSAFELSDRTLELAKAKMEEARSKAAILNAIAMEKVWLLRAEIAERGGAAPTRQIAELMVDTRVQRQKAAQICLDNIRVISHEVNFQHQRSKNLAGTNAISQEELFLIKTASDELGTFIPTAEAELVAVTASLEEARRDLDTVVVQEAAQKQKP